MICSYSVTPFSRLTTLLYRTFPRTTVAYVKCAAGNGTGAALVAGGCDGAGRMWPDVAGRECARLPGGGYAAAGCVRAWLGARCRGWWRAPWGAGGLGLVRSRG